MEKRLLGKVALVTGGSSGIGRSTALALAREGACVAVSARADLKGGERTASDIRASGGSAVFVQADVGNSAEVRRLVSAAVSEFGQLDIGFNNAGTQGPPATYTGDLAEAHWDHVLNVNLTGTFLCMKYELRQMLVQGGGTIVNTSSISGLNGTRGCPAYVASKHGVVGLTRAAALDYAAQGIRINAICPGFTRTPLLEGFVDLRDSAGEDRIAGRIPLRRIADPAEIAEVVVWLCSDGASYLTGHALTVDGGFTTQL